MKFSLINFNNLRYSCYNHDFVETNPIELPGKLTIVDKQILKILSWIYRVESECIVQVLREWIKYCIFLTSYLNQIFWQNIFVLQDKTGNNFVF